MLDVRDLVEYGDFLFAATDGGVLIFDQNTRLFSGIDNSDGLYATDLLALALDGDGYLWLGSNDPNGVIQVYDPMERRSVSVFDFDFTSVIDFAVGDSLVYGVFKENQDWGLIEFIRQDEIYIYRDIYRNWPSDWGEIAGVALYGDYVWVAGDQGLWRGNWRTDNLKDPANWEQPMTEIAGPVTTFKQYDDHLLLVASQIAYRLELADNSISWQWNYFASSYLFWDLIETSDGSYWGMLRRTLIKLTDTAKDWQISTNYEISNLFPLNDNTVLASSPQGICILDSVNRVFERYAPNCPITNSLTAVTVLSDGRVVAASKEGLSIRDSRGWRNIVETLNDTIIHNSYNYDYYIADSLPIDFGGYVADLEQGPDGLVYCGIRGTYPVPNENYNLRGGGIVIIDIDDPLNYTLIDTAALDYYYTSSNPKPYLVVKELTFDNYNNLWVGDTYSTKVNQTLHVRNSSGEWGHFTAKSSENPLPSAPNSITVDDWNRVWISAELWEVTPSGVTNGGLAVMKYTGDAINPDSVEWKSVVTGTSVWSTVMNDLGTLYVLTPEGLTGMKLQDSMTNPVVSQNEYEYFPNTAFGLGSKLRLDYRGNVWATSSSQGIRVLMENTTYWPTIDGLTFDNSGLLSDSVTDLEFDDISGLAYITTDRGLNSLKIPFAIRRNSAVALKIFPSPFHIPSDKPVVIDGLDDNSLVKIMTLSGEVVRSIEIESANIDGYQAFWDGRNKNGKLVGSGVYLIVAYTSGESSKVGKITVIRH